VVGGIVRFIQLRQMFYRATRDRFLDHGVASEGVVGEEVR
jgi:hypothetical protein